MMNWMGGAKKRLLEGKKKVNQFKRKVIYKQKISQFTNRPETIIDLSQKKSITSLANLCAKPAVLEQPIKEISKEESFDSLESRDEFGEPVHLIGGIIYIDEIIYLN